MSTENEHPIFQVFATLDALHDAAQADYVAALEKENRVLRRHCHAGDMIVIILIAGILLQAVLS